MTADRELQKSVLEELSWEPGVTAAHLGVTGKDGVVALTGHVENYVEKFAAEHDVRRLYGVAGASNQTTIRTRVDAIHIRDDMVHALHRSWAFDRAISVVATGGRVKLSGTVRTPCDRRVAGATAWAAPGATVVENDILVA
jgi:osmotically-inducible protein OsmY